MSTEWRGRRATALVAWSRTVCGIGPRRRSRGRRAIGREREISVSETMIDESARNGRVVVVTTGGTIAMQHDDEAGGAVPQLGAEDFSRALPSDIPALRIEEFVNLPSSHFTLDVIEGIRNRVSVLVEEPETIGVVVTHGTDTMEETAYLIDLTVGGGKPVALTGAMRTASEIGYDGYANLASAVRVVAASQARGLGAVVVFNDEIHAARRVTKMHTLSTAAFQSPGWGPVGRVEGDVVTVGQLMGRERFPWHGLERRVELIKLTVGAGPEPLEDGVRRGARGLVIEGLGGGRVPLWWLPVIESARRKGIAVAIASRCPAGRVWDRYGYPGAYRSLRDLGCLFAEGLNGQKSRVKLMAVLAAAGSGEDVETLWARY